MLGIPNPMPKTYHPKTDDVDRQAQQDILLKNTIRGIVRSIEASRTTVLAVQHLRIIEKYNEYINSSNMNLYDYLSLLPISLYNPMHEALF